MEAVERLPEYPAYNYPHFLAGPDEAEWTDFIGRNHVGRTAPDFDLPRLPDMEPVRLSDLTKDRTVVLEFGNYT